MSDDEEDYGSGGFDFGAPAPLPEGVRKEVIKEADSKAQKSPKPGDEVTVDYSGSLEDGTEFDSSHSRDAPLVFTLGKGEVIKGWDLGIATMKTGEVAKFTFAPEFAYGDEGSPPKIPPGATLTFIIELVSSVSKCDLFGDGMVIKSELQEGKGWQHPKKGSEVRLSLKVANEDGSVVEELAGIDYTIGSTSKFGALAKVLDKALPGMMENEKCSLRCAQGSADGEGSFSTHAGALTLELQLEEVYTVTDVSLLKDKTVMKKQLKEGVDHERPGDGRRCSLRVESVVDNATGKPVAGFSAPKDVRFIVGTGEACDALEGAVRDMRKSERAAITCSTAEKARDRGLGLQALEASAGVTLIVELSSFEKPFDIWRMCAEEKVEFAAVHKDIGGQLFKAQRFEFALDRYKKVIEDLRETNKWSDECKQQAAELTKAAELNTAMCYLRLGDNTSALSTCNTIIKKDHCNVKAFFRRAKAHNGRGEYVEAARDLERVLELDPANAEAKAMLPHVKKAQKLADRDSSSTFSKMCQGFGKLGSGKENKQPEINTVQEEPEPPRNLDVVTVTFRIEYKPSPGETLRVTGSPEVLGAWDAAKSLEMTLLPPKWEPPIGSGRPPPEHHFWEATVEVPISEERAEYKYLIRSPGKEDHIEEGSEHKVNLGGLGGSRQRLTDSWRGPGR